jgi:hypothetical protein
VKFTRPARPSPSTSNSWAPAQKKCRNGAVGWFYTRPISPPAARLIR